MNRRGLIGAMVGALGIGALGRFLPALLRTTAGMKQYSGDEDHIIGHTPGVMKLVVVRMTILPHGKYEWRLLEKRVADAMYTFDEGSLEARDWVEVPGVGRIRAFPRCAEYTFTTVRDMSWRVGQVLVAKTDLL